MWLNFDWNFVQFIFSTLIDVSVDTTANHRTKWCWLLWVIWVLFENVIKKSVGVLEINRDLSEVNLFGVVKKRENVIFDFRFRGGRREVCLKWGCIFTDLDNYLFIIQVKRFFSNIHHLQFVIFELNYILWK